MKTVTVTTSYDVYSYDELSDKAKENVMRWYLDGQEPYIFSLDIKEDLNCLFGKNDLDVQFSLASCQGDGLNIYGEIDAESIFKCLEEHRGGTQLAKFEDVLTDKEKRTILNYVNESGRKIKLPMNNRYCYSLADYIEIAEDLKYDLYYYKNLNVEALEKFEKLVRDIFHTLCNSYEEQGYEYFYEVDEEVLKDFCEANGYEFLEDGTIF